jgi:hypothetical protein
MWALAALQELGYVVETDWRPNRVELVAPARGWKDLHPLVLDEDGRARQAALDGGYHRFDRSWFTVGELGGRPVPCVTAQAQRLFREGYEHRPVDGHASTYWRSSTEGAVPDTPRRSVSGPAYGTADRAAASRTVALEEPNARISDAHARDEFARRRSPTAAA